MKKYETIIAALIIGASIIIAGVLIGNILADSIREAGYAVHNGLLSVR